MTNKILATVLSFFIILNPISGLAQDEAGNALVDETLQDLTIVLATGAVGAVLGLSTLSFVDKPKDHTKNIAIGGAIGIVIGVGVVIFSQATKSQTTIVSEIAAPHSEYAAEGLSRLEFSEHRIAAKYLQPTTVGINLAF